MKEIVVSVREEGQRLDKLLGKYLKEAPKSFLYKMLRKKNITLNGKKADGSEKLQDQDVIRIFFTDETLAKFTGVSVEKLNRMESAGNEKSDGNMEFAVDEDSVEKKNSAGIKKYSGNKTKVNLDIVFENEHVLFINKPVGMLSQKAQPSDVSLVEYVTDYLLESGQLTDEDLMRFRPGICNRLDRNTSGLVAAGKTISGLQEMNLLFHDRTMKKYYRCLVVGKIDKPSYLEGYLTKNNRTNQVMITKTAGPDSKPIQTEYQPICWNEQYTLLEVHLITGRSHQIRAHLASIGHPIIGDGKYGSKKVNDKMRSQYRVTSQLLHAYRIEMPELNGALSSISKQKFTAPLPALFQSVVDELFEDEI